MSWAPTGWRPGEITAQTQRREIGFWTAVPLLLSQCFLACSSITSHALKQSQASSGIHVGLHTVNVLLSLQAWWLIIYFIFFSLYSLSNTPDLLNRLRRPEDKIKITKITLVGCKSHLLCIIFWLGGDWWCGVVGLVFFFFPKSGKQVKLLRKHIKFQDPRVEKVNYIAFG